MEIISAMKVLIIFLIIFAILFLISIFFKIKVLFSIEVDNLQINTNIKVFGKKFSGKFLLKKQSKTVVKINSSKKKIRLKDTKKNKFDIIKDIVGLIEIKRLDIAALVGTPFIGLTVFLTQLFNIVIPSLYTLPFRKKEKMRFKVMPDYKEFKVRINVSGEIAITPYNVIIVFLKYFCYK